MATYAPILKKEDGRIDWTRPAPAIYNRIRGLVPWPGAYTGFRGHLLHIWKRARPVEGGGAVGRVWRRKNRVCAGCGEATALELLEVQLEGKGRMSAEAFANGQRLSDNEILGESDQLNLPLGYRYSAAYAGIRKVEKDDVGLIVSGMPAAAAAVFTQNRVQAAPVRLSKPHLRASRGQVGAIIVNAGNANCATRTGDRVALATCRAAAKGLKLPVTQVLPASTGVIGVELDPKLITDALPGLIGALSEDRFEDVARAIMTTDRVPKMASREVELAGGRVRIAGMTKGSGMIHPQHGDHAGFRPVGRRIAAPRLKTNSPPRRGTSYNRVSVDGDTSTNDTLVLMANGASGVRAVGQRRSDVR